MNAEKLLKKVLDNSRKLQARSAIPTGGDGRTTSEAINTSANAKAYAMMNTKKPKLARF